jgi:hypothetical protein
VYFLPAVGWEKVIEIRRFSNGTAIVKVFGNSDVFVLSPTFSGREKNITVSKGFYYIWGP